jgi:hypothetical protein
MWGFSFCESRRAVASRLSWRGEELNVKKDLPPNKPVVEVHVPTEQTRTLTFQCATGMQKGVLVIG